ncbi:MAG: sulfatase-like hydrolase/transferase [bacterium]|nr:sulfatase-like hydrolase/transferase [bacterium]
MRTLVLLVWLIAGVVATAVLAPGQVGQDGGRRQPHVVILVSDDAGYADFSIHGAKDVATPRIDSIAENGVRFAAGYVSGAVCSPTRAGLVTGRYQQRFGHELNIPPRFSEENGLPVEEVTIADHLRKSGYRTIALGKWHLGYADKFHPLSRGFDDYFGFLQGARSFFPLDKPTRLNRLLKGREVQPEKFDYMTDELAARTAEYIAGHDDERPLLLYVAFNAVHTPMHALPADLEGAEGSPKRRKLIAMTRALDRAVGRILDALTAAGMLDDTLLFFVNDNGGATNNASSNAPLRGRKGQVFEGGIRVPFLVQWPARLPAGKVWNEPVIALDIAATALAMAGVSAPVERPLDGIDLVPLLIGEREPQERALFWRHGDKWAIRQGRWKLLTAGSGSPPQLYDLVADLSEQQDVAAAEPERVAALQETFDAWNGELVEPRWRYRRRKK